MTDDEEDYEDDDEEEQAGEEGPPPVIQTPAAAAAAAAASALGPKDWVGLQSMPAQTQQSLMEALSVLRAQNQTEMTVVFVGKQGAGKSSTLNSVLNERVAQSAPFQPESLRPLLASRQAAGFTVSFLDTPGLIEGDQVSQRGLASVKLAMKDREVHAVVYMDRLDAWRVDNKVALDGAYVSWTLEPTSVHVLRDPFTLESTDLVGGAGATRV